MRKFILTALLLCIAIIPTCSANPVVAKAHKTTHSITMPSLLGEGGSCSATAIGPHALLTASHCVAVSAVLTVDGVDAEILGMIGDGTDHTIYFLGGVTFKDFAEFANSTPEQGDEVFVFGNPGELHDQFRAGYVSGYDKKADDEAEDFDLGALIFGDMKPKPKKHTGNDVVVITYYDFNGFFGDSGSAIFNKDGKIIGVTSIISVEHSPEAAMKFMGGFSIRFTPNQLKDARDY